jgi:predicted phage-related endonuclease
MANDREDFLPEVRNAALWSGDARRYATGKAGEVYAEKIGVKPLDDLSDVELVQMGHVFQEPIMREYARRNQIEFKDADYQLAHPTETYLKSHFDYISEDGKTLYEVKNLGIHQRKHYGDEGSDHIDLGYRVQCLHESVVHRIESVVLVVCFGGQEIVGYPLQFSADQMDMHVKEMAKFWGKIQTRNFDPETMADAAKMVYKQDSGKDLIATQSVEQKLAELKRIKAALKPLEAEEKRLTGEVQSYMLENAQLLSTDGSVLATWKTSKPSQKFSEELFKQSMPDLHAKFIVEQMGSRRFLVK